MLNIIKVEVENRIAKNNTRVFTKSYFTDFNDGMGCRKVYEMEYRYNKYGFLTNKVLTAYNYKPLANTDYMMWDNTSIINIHIGYYTKQITRGIDCFMK